MNLRSFCDARIRGTASSRHSTSLPARDRMSEEVDEGYDFVMSGLETEILSPLASSVEERVSTHECVTMTGDSHGSGVYTLSQSFAIVRHAERLDRTPDWQFFPDREKWPNDTPLTIGGHERAREVGQELMRMDKHFDLIISSPYLRCAQTACRIAQEMNLPIQFDLDLGEVFDRHTMGPGVQGPQHRDPKELEAQLAPDFPDVSWASNDNKISIEGRQQTFPESLDEARMRFVVKLQQLLQKAASELMSIVVVTHGDALGAVIGMMKYDWKVQDIPYVGYAVASRRVPVLEQHSPEVLFEEPVYENPEQWELHLSPGIKVSEIHPYSKKRAFALHKHELKKIDSNNNLSSMDSSYLVTPPTSPKYLQRDRAGSNRSLWGKDSPPSSPKSPKGSSSSWSDRVSPAEAEPWLDGFSNEQAVRYMKVLSGFGLNSKVAERLIKLAGCSRHLVDASPLCTPVATPHTSPDKEYTKMLPKVSSSSREIHALTRIVTL